MKTLPCFLFASCLLAASAAHAADRISILIPGGEGGGWDTTARVVGATLEKTGAIAGVTYRNLSGAGGGRALLDLIDHADERHDTLMVQSTPLIFRAITGEVPASWHDMTPLVILIAEYQAVAVRADSPYKTTRDLVEAVSKNKTLPIAGGSAKYSLDHATWGMILKAAGHPVDSMRYIPSDAGAAALERLLSDQVIAVVGGFGELLPVARGGKIRILGLTAAERLPGVDVPTFKEQGFDLVLANWRGFFAAPRLPAALVKNYADMLVALSKTPEWNEARLSNQWEPLVLSGDDVPVFLTKQEQEVKSILADLGFGKAP
jgi:putative tricarboxylic transport membrane protein